MNLKIVSPIFGFDKLSSATLTEIDDFFFTLVGGDIEFTLINPTKLRDYDIEIPESYSQLLDIKKGDTISVYNIVLIQNPIQNSFINFAAPIIINEDKKLLVQVALDAVKYPHYGISESISDYL